MIHRHSGLGCLTAGLAGTAALITLMIGGPAVAAPAAAAAGAMPAAGAPAAAGPSRRVLLIDGDQVLAVPDAGGPVPGGVVPGTAGTLAGSLLTLGVGGQAYEIPVAAVPYLGRGLDPGLFQLSALLGQEAGGRLPVRIGYRGTLPAVPGVTITSSGGGAAQGYLTASSASVFGAALDRQYLADHARGSYGSDGIFGGGVSIALAGTTAPRPGVTPDYPMSTLTVTGTNAAGKPDTGDEILVFNADNSSRFSDPIESASVFYDGAAKFSVPTGHYWAIGDFVSVAGDGAVSVRLDVLPQLTVAGQTTVHTTAKAAASQITMVTPKPTEVMENDFYLQRDGRSGPPTTLGLAGFGGPIWVSPVSRPPTVGTLRAYAAQVRFSPPGNGVPYQYALEYGDPPGTISSQRYVVRPKDVATVSESYYQTQVSPGFWDLLGTLPASGLFGSVGASVEPEFSLPGRDVLFAGGNVPSLTWQRDYVAINSAAPGVVYEGGQYQGFVRLPAGAHLAEGWNRYPLHPDANANLAPGNAANPSQPSATRSGNTLRLDTTPFTDNQRGDYGLGFVDLGGGAASTGSYQIDQDGRKIAGGTAVTTVGGFPMPDFSTHVVLSPKPSVIKVTLNAAVAGQDFPLSTASQTVWTWRSAYQRAAKLPPGWYCYENPDTLAQNNDCAVQPMMTLLYDVHRMALDGSAPAGRQVVGLTVGHLQLAQASRITGATVSVSFDGGKSWHPATVTRAGQGQFTAVFAAPAGAYVTLRTSAADAARGGITETITRAYQIAS